MLLQNINRNFASADDKPFHAMHSLICILRRRPKRMPQRLRSAGLPQWRALHGALAELRPGEPRANGMRLLEDLLLWAELLEGYEAGYYGI